MKDKHDQFLDYYHDCKDKLLTYFMYRLNFNREQAEDLLMDVVLKAYENFDKYNPEKGTFKTWIFTLAHNHLVNFWRGQKRVASLDELEEQGFLAAAVEAEDTASNRIEGEKIQRVLALMKDSEREIITLRYLQDLGYEEISKITGKKEGAIRTSLSRALNHFSQTYHKFYP